MSSNDDTSTSPTPSSSVVNDNRTMSNRLPSTSSTLTSPHKFNPQFNRLTGPNAIALSTSSPLIAKYMNLNQQQQQQHGSTVNQSHNEDKPSNSTNDNDNNAVNQTSVRSIINTDSYLSSKLNVSV